MIICIIGLNCYKYITDFDSIKPENSKLFSGKYYCESPGTYICGKTYGIIEFNKNMDAEVSMFYECKGMYFKLFTETLTPRNEYRYFINYRGKKSDIIIKDKDIFVFISSAFKTELLKLNRIPSSKRIYSDIIENALDRMHIE